MVLRNKRTREKEIIQEEKKNEKSSKLRKIKSEGT